MKSLIHIDTLRTKYRSKLAEVSLYSKILYLLLVEQNLRAMFGEAWGCVDQEHHGTWWRLYKLLKARREALVIAQWTWSPARVQEGLHVMMERSRKRKLQCLPSRVVALAAQSCCLFRGSLIDAKYTHCSGGWRHGEAPHAASAGWGGVLPCTMLWQWCGFPHIVSHTAKIGWMTWG